MKTVLLGDEIELVYGKGLPQRSRIAGRCPVFGSNGQVDTHNAALVEGPGIIVGRKGSVGEVIWTNEDFWPIDTTYYVRPRNPDDNLSYWYYQLKTLGLNHLNSHSAIPGLNRDVAYAKPVIKRTPDEQNKIAEVLGMFDQKIELNRRMNETLKQMGQTLFKHYFIYNPEAEKWPVLKIEEIITTIESGSRPKGGSSDAGIPSIGAENIQGLGVYDYSKEKYVSNKYFQELKRGIVASEDVLLYKDGAYVGKKSLFMDSFPHELCCINEHVFILRTNKRLPSQFFLYFWLDQPNITKEIINAGVKAAQPGINQTNVKNLPILVPPVNVTEKFDNQLRPFMESLFLNAKQNNKLSRLRDSLLPCLISGKIEV